MDIQRLKTDLNYWRRFAPIEATHYLQTPNPKYQGFYTEEEWKYVMASGSHKGFLHIVKWAIDGSAIKIIPKPSQPKIMNCSDCSCEQLMQPCEACPNEPKKYI